MIDRDTGWEFTPASIKGVVTDASGRVLLGKNPRDEWELPGGWPDPSDLSLEATVAREVREESGLEIVVGELIACTMFHPVPSARVVLVVFACAPPSPAGTRASEEHREFRFFRPDELDGLTLDPTYRAVLDQAGARRVGTGSASPE